jgi:hypothetical protein
MELEIEATHQRAKIGRGKQTRKPGQASAVEEEMSITSPTIT